MIAIVDYGAGNLFSVGNALDFLQIENAPTNRPEDIEKADGIILPGVGAFPTAMAKLEQSGIKAALLEQAGKKTFLGICLGMQMLFEYGYEFSQIEGLGLLPGEVRRIEPADSSFKVPHMGWNCLDIKQDNPLLKGVPEGSYVYFVHSYQVHTEEAYLVASTDYGCTIPALVAKGNLFGAQFHPEKSGQVGLQILQNFAALCQEKKGKTI